MSKFIRASVCFFIAVFFISGCKKKELDPQYARPATLAQPIYQQLQALGNFTSLLKLIDKSGYKETLSGSGYWTFFAPNDDAFKAFFQERNIKSADDVSTDLATSIVRYSLIYDGEISTNLSSFFSPLNAFVPNQAFRRRTVYYDFVYNDVDPTGAPVKAIAENSNVGYVTGDFNNKRVPIYLTGFMSNNGLSATDYQFLYPGSTYSGFNFARASILPNQMDIIAQNGVIDVIDKVCTPPLSIDQYITTTSNYSAFSSLLYKFVTFTPNPGVSQTYNVLTGKTDPVYTKVYSGALAFAPNSETYSRSGFSDVNLYQTHSYSAVIPNNAAVSAFFKNVILKYYPAGTTYDQLFLINSNIIRDFINAHLFTIELWPSKFSTTTYSGLGEAPHVSLANDIVDVQPLSNGFFYGSSKVSVPNIFSTIYASVYLNPKYSIMLRAMDAYGYAPLLQTPSLQYGLIPVSDAVLNSMGFTYDPFFASTNPFKYNGVQDNIMLRRILAMHVIDFTNKLVTDYSGEGFLKTIGGEYIRYKNNRLISSGTLDSVNVATQSVRIDSIKLTDFKNGPALYANGAMSYTANVVGGTIQNFGTLTTEPYYKFFQYIKQGSDLFNASTKEIAGLTIGVDCTVFIPTNAAMDQAVRDGVLPGTVTGTIVTPNFNPSLITDRQKIARFITYHLVNKQQIAPDGLTTGIFPTVAKTSAGVAALITITNNTAASLTIMDQTGRVANVISPTGSRLASRAIIHQIDNYLNYTY